MASPQTYSEWVAILERFGQGDDTIFDEMNKGSFDLDAGTAKRFYLRVEEVYKKRKQSWLEKFQRSFQFQNFKSEDDFEITLRDGKQNLLPLLKFVTSPALPKDLSGTLHKDLTDFVSEIKKSLKNNVTKSSNNDEKMLILLNTFGLFENTAATEINTNSPNQNSGNNIPSPGRRIIF